MYATLAKALSKHFSLPQLIKYGFNLSPMYRSTTGRVTWVSDDLTKIKISIPRKYKNYNYAGSIFGGAMFSATDPIYVVQLIQILGPDYIVWDKSSTILFRKPAWSSLTGTFHTTMEEIENIKSTVASSGETTIIKKINLVSDDSNRVVSEISKNIYIADKKFYKDKFLGKK